MNWPVIVVLVGFAGFFLAKWNRAKSDVKSTAEGLRIRQAERRHAAVGLAVVVGAVIMLLLSKGGGP